MSGIRRMFGGRSRDLDTRLAAIIRQLESYEQRLGDVSRAHTVAELETRSQLTELHERLTELEAVNRGQREQIEALQAQNADRIARIRSMVESQREALAGLETALEGEPSPALELDSLPGQASPP
jgi:DNA repair ATPase RecN